MKPRYSCLRWGSALLILFIWVSSGLRAAVHCGQKIAAAADRADSPTKLTEADLQIAKLADVGIFTSFEAALSEMPELFTFDQSKQFQFERKIQINYLAYKDEGATKFIFWKDTPPPPPRSVLAVAIYHLPQYTRVSYGGSIEIQGAMTNPESFQVSTIKLTDRDPEMVRNQIGHPHQNLLPQLLSQLRANHILILPDTTVNLKWTHIKEGLTTYSELTARFLAPTTLDERERPPALGLR